MMPIWLDLLIAAFIVVGAVFALIGSYGLAKLGDFLKRIHGPTKASTLGVGSVLIASMLYFSFATRSASVHELLITLFIFLTAPVSAHLLIRAVLGSLGKDELPQKPPVSTTPVQDGGKATAGGE